MLKRGLQKRQLRIVMGVSHVKRVLSVSLRSIVNDYNKNFLNQFYKINIQFEYLIVYEEIRLNV